MDNKDKNKWQVRGAVLGIFLLGFMAGLLALNIYQNWSAKSAGQTTARKNIEQTFEQLGLTEEQREEVRNIFEEARNQMKELRKENTSRRGQIRRQTDERLQKILTTEQWQEFQRIRSESQRGSRGGER